MKSLPQIYEFTTYRDYLVAELPAKFGRGAQQKFADMLRCQPSFISQVLKGRNELSMEYAFRANEFLGHGPDEKQYFMTMVSLSKAGSYELKKYYLGVLDSIRQQKMQVHKIVKKHALNEQEMLIYYSNWLYVSVHMLVTIEGFDTMVALQTKLNANEEELQQAVRFLINAGLLIEVDGRLAVGESHIHLKKTSPIAHSASVATRLRVLDKMKLNDPVPLHFTNNFTVSQAGYTKIKKALLEAIAETGEIIEAEAPDRFCTLVIDLLEH